MTWNHRIVKIIDTDGEAWLSIREAYYNAKGELTGYTIDPVDVSGRDIDELRQTLKWMTKALAEPVIDDATVKFSDD